MKKRFLLPLLLLFLPATIISVAYAGFVYSNKVDTDTQTNKGKIDDVKPNFKLDENNYTIYFFPSAQAARINFESPYDLPSIQQKILNESPYRDKDRKDKDPTSNNGAAWGFWSDKTGNGNEVYFPKVINTVGGPSIFLEQFESIGEPLTVGYDKKKSWGSYDNKYHVTFSGWTAVKSSALNGYASQGEYDYISAFDDLTKIDGVSSDGTNSGDKVIFVYPIFTSGKNYDNPENAVQLTGNGSRYLSRVPGDQNKTYYYYNNLLIDKKTSWSLSFAGLNGFGGWFGDWGNYRKTFYDKNSPETSIIKENGIYNIYVYLQKTGWSFSTSDANSSDFNTKINSSIIPLIYEDAFDKPDNYYVKLGTTGYFWMFIKVEKVYEFRLAGTEGRGFAFDTAGQLYVSHFSSSDYSGPQLGSELWKMYYLDNVFLEKGKNNLFTEYTNSSGGKYKIRNTVFSFLPSDENLATINGIQQMTPEELNYVNENEPDLNVKGNYKGISDTSFKKIDNSQNEYIKNHVNLPNYVPDKDYADYFFASEFKYSGYCKVLIKVDFGTSGDNKGKPISIHVAVAPYLSNKHKIYVYPEFYKNGEPFDFSYYIDNETKLIDPENNAKLMKRQITSFEVLASNDYQLDGNQDISVVGTAGTMKLSKYLSDYEILDHLTNARIIISGSKPKSYRRHMACWQKGLFSQYNKE